MNDEDELALQYTHGDMPVLSVILSIIDEGEGWSRKNERTIDEVKAPLVERTPPFLLVPRQLHGQIILYTLSCV